MEEREEKNKAIISWWIKLNDRKSPGSNAIKSKLKRCESPLKAALISDTFTIESYLKNSSIEAAATIAGILAHVKPEGLNEKPYLGSSLGSKKNNRVVFSESRFQKLINSRNWDELYTNLRRAVLILDGMVNPSGIIEVIKKWDFEFKEYFNEQPSERLRIKLSRDYYRQVNK